MWTPGGLPGGAVRSLEKMPGVLHVAEVTGGLIWMDEATSGNLPDDGYQIPIEIAFVGRSEHGQMFPGAPPNRHFSAGNLIFSRTGFALRESAAGAYSLSSDRGDFTGRCCISDRAAMGYEALSTGAPPADWGSSYALVRAARRPSVEDVRRAVGSGLWRVRSHSDTPYLRYADAVVPQMLLKERFGEFSARPSPGGILDIAPHWTDANIVRGKVPILGRVECHRALFEQLRVSLGTALRQNLGAQVKPDEYAGCFNARFIGRDPSGRISSHAWGAAFDIAAASNPLGAPPTLDTRLVEIFKRAGLNWGGDWLIPDGMHFEWSS